MADVQRVIEALRVLGDVIVEVVTLAHPRPIIAGELYAQLMTALPYLTAEQFNAIMEGLVQAGRIKRLGHHLYGRA